MFGLIDNLKTLMAFHGKTNVNDLSRAINIPQPTLYRLLSGQTAQPRNSVIESLANYFGISTNQLCGYEDLPELSSSKIKNNLNLNLKTCPIILWENLSDWPNIDFNGYEEVILSQTGNSGDNFAIKMKGSSMEPIFPEGCLLIFDTKKSANHHDTVIAYIQKSQSYVFKNLLIDGDNLFIKSINPELNEVPILQLTPEDRIIATLNEARIKY